MKIRLDRSKTFSTVFGDRLPNDPHYRVAFSQDGLPFDHDGELVPDDNKLDGDRWMAKNSEGKDVEHQPLWTSKMRERLAKKIQRMEQALARPDEPETIDEESPDEAKAAAAREVNLEMWLRGEARYEAVLLFAAARERFKKRYDKIGELVVDAVVDEKIVPEEAVCPALKRFLDQMAPRAA